MIQRALNQVEPSWNGIILSDICFHFHLIRDSIDEFEIFFIFFKFSLVANYTNVCFVENETLRDLIVEKEKK